MTKWQIKTEFYKMLLEGKGKELDQRAWKLYEQGKVTYGWYLVICTHDNYHCQRIMDTKNITKRDLEYHFNNLKIEIEKNLKEVEKQENTPFEESQKQVLIKTNKIQYMVG